MRAGGGEDGRFWGNNNWGLFYTQNNKNKHAIELYIGIYLLFC